MAAPNMGPVYYCRGADVGALYGGSLGRLLEQKGCEEGGATHFFRQAKHPCCRACRKLVDAECPKGNGAWFMLDVDKIKIFHAEANIEDEAAHAQWESSHASSSARPRSRSPIRPLTTSPKRRRRDDTDSEEEVNAISDAHEKGRQLWIALGRHYGYCS
jgi:hypothetical protein